MGDIRSVSVTADMRGPERGPLARVLSASSSAACRFDGGNVDLFHFHHSLERAFGGRAIGIGHGVHQRPRGDLPG